MTASKGTRISPKTGGQIPGVLFKFLSEAETYTMSLVNN
jgi:hypothetical protein